MKKTFGILLALMCFVAVNAKELYLVGTATPAVWKKGEIRKQTQLVETFEGSNVFVYIGNLPGNPGYTSGMAEKRFKIVDGLESWVGYRAEQPYTDITDKVGAVIARPADNNTYPDNFWFVRETGTYKVTVDLNTNKIHCFKYNAPSLVDNVYQITNFNELIWFSDKVSDGTLAEADATLSANLNQGEQIYTPIGTLDHPYKGTFDGGFHTITLNLDNPAFENQGIFGVLTDGAEIKNLTAAGNIKGKKYVGGIAGSAVNKGIVIFTNCANNASITAVEINAGGILGVNMENNASINMTNCYNVGEITSDKESGAISGWLGVTALLKNCYNIGKVLTTEGISDEFARHNGATFTNCYYAESSATTAQEDEDVVMVSDDEVKNGALCFYLGEPFGQTLNTDNYPMIGATHKKVYGNNGDVYSNYGVTIDENLYAAIVAPVALTFENNDLKAYGAKALKSHVLLIPALTVPEGAKIIVHAETAGEYALSVFTGAGFPEIENELKVAAEEITAAGTEFVLGSNESEKGFVKSTVGNVITTGTCYLTITDASNDFYPFTLDPNEGPITSINVIETLEKGGKIFNLNGQELAKPVKGVNIINGKKVLVK